MAGKAVDHSRAATPVEMWHNDHVRFQRLLDELRRHMDRFHSGQRPDYERMLGIIDSLRETGERTHHPREDVAFERLAMRCPDLALPLARLKQEHRVITQAGEKLRELLSEALDGAVLPRAEVEIAAAMYLVYYGNHIAHEEEDILGRADQALTAEDWEAVRKAV
jgi:hemerythrin-like domain-containing protein